MDLKNKKVLLTGATGFIGGHLAFALLLEGAELFCIIRKPNPKSYFYKLGLNKKSKLVKCDLSSPDQVEKLLNKNNFDFVFHIAGILRPKDMQEAFYGNIASTLNLLESSKKTKNLKGIILASSSRSKPEDLSGEKLEAMLQRPYDLSKTVSDLVAESYTKSCKLPIVTVKYANVFGPGDDLVKPLRLTSDIMQTLKTGKTFQPKNNSDDKVDFLFVRDVVEALINAAKGIEKFKFKTTVLKPSAQYSIKDWAEKIAVTVKKNNPKSDLERAILETFKSYK